MIDCVENCKIHLGCLTDYSFVKLSIKTGENKRGQGVWKFNNLHLLDEAFCKDMDILISNIINESHNLNPSDR